MYKSQKIMEATLFYALLIIILTFVSGYADALGFNYANLAWTKDGVEKINIAKSLFFFGIGIGTYICLIPFLKKFGISSPVLQTLGWFGCVIIVLAIVDGKIFKWPLLDQIIATMVFVGIAWLMYRVE